MNKFSKAFAAFTLLLLALSGTAQDDTRPTATWQVQKYDIVATLPQAEAERDLAVKAKLDLKNISARPASSLTLRIASAADVSSVNINGSQIDFTKAEEKVNAATSLQRIVLRIPSVPPGGTLAATVDYKFSVKEKIGRASCRERG